MGLNTPPSPEDIIAHPGTSYWLKDALQRALDRDPCDALGDAIMLAQVLARRFNEIKNATARSSHESSCCSSIDRI